jgi:hypothetical protein
MSLEALLFAAIESPYGVRVETSSPNDLRAKLYKIRRADMESFSALSFVISPSNPEKELWLVKTKGQQDAAE